ncbi:MAG: deoxynucleoside kinase, partial [Lactobacillus acidophilus]
YYKPWYEKYDYSPKMVIDGDKYDFMSSEADREIVLDQIVDKLKEVGKLPMDWDKSTDIQIEA